MTCESLSRVVDRHVADCQACQMEHYGFVFDDEDKALFLSSPWATA